MNETETLVLDKLNDTIKIIKEILELEPPLGDILMFGVRMTMDLYEAMAKGETYLANDAVEFLAQMQGIPVHDLLYKTYPNSQEPRVSADEDLTKFIMDSAKSYEKNIDGYKEAVGDLVSDFKKAARAARHEG